MAVPLVAAVALLCSTLPPSPPPFVLPPLQSPPPPPSPPPLPGMPPEPPPQGPPPVLTEREQERQWAIRYTFEKLWNATLERIQTRSHPVAMALMDHIINVTCIEEFQDLYDVLPGCLDDLADAVNITEQLALSRVNRTIGSTISEFLFTCPASCHAAAAAAAVLGQPEKECHVVNVTFGGRLEDGLSPLLQVVGDYASYCDAFNRLSHLWSRLGMLGNVITADGPDEMGESVHTLLRRVFNVPEDTARLLMVPAQRLIDLSWSWNGTEESAGSDDSIDDQGSGDAARGGGEAGSGEMSSGDDVSSGYDVMN